MERSSPAKPDARRSRLLALGLLVLSPVCAEYVAGYDTSTGDPVALLGGLLIFVPLYGCPALLIREVAQRAGLGWPGILLLAGAFGLIEAGVVDQSTFSTSYREIPYWDDLLLPTFIEPLGIGAFLTLLFISGHVVFSMCVPISIVEGFCPDRRREPWVARLGLVLAALLYCSASLLVLVDHLQNESSHASPQQLAVTLIVVGLLIAGAFAQRGRTRPALHTLRAPRPLVVGCVASAAAAGFGVVPPNWIGVGIQLALLTTMVAAIAHFSRSRGWDVRHLVALAGGALIAATLLAFLTPPLGEVSDLRKYSHNVAFLLGALALVASTARRARRQSPEVADDACGHLVGVDGEAVQDSGSPASEPRETGEPQTGNR